jgi:hypothetical protein
MLGVCVKYICTDKIVEHFVLVPRFGERDGSIQYWNIFEWITSAFLSFCHFVCHCAVCPASIYGF